MSRRREHGCSEEEEGGNGRKEIVQCYRMGEWITIATNELVVGDVISLVSPSIHNKQQMNRQNVIKSAHDHDRGCTIPADLLLLNGRAVVNEVDRRYVFTQQSTEIISYIHRSIKLNNNIIAFIRLVYVVIVG